MNEERKSEIDMSAKNIEINGPIDIENSESDEMIGFVTDENVSLDVIKPDEDEKSNQSDLNENDGEQTQMPNGSLQDKPVSIEEDDDNDLMSPNEASRDESAQSSKSGVFSHLNVSPEVASMLVTALPTSKKAQRFRSACRLSSKTNSIGPSANLNPNTQNTYNSPSKSSGLNSPKMGSSSSTKSSAQVSRSSPCPSKCKLCKIYYIITIRPSYSYVVDLDKFNYHISFHHRPMSEVKALDTWSQFKFSKCNIG